MLSNNRLNRLIKENIHNLLLFESQESDSQKLAKNLYQKRTGSSREEADNFVRNTLRNDITSLRDKKIAKFTLGVTRMFLDKQINNANIISDLNTTLKLLTPHINEYDKNLNNLSAQELINRFKQVRLDNLENEKNEINNMSFGQSNYNIVRIDTFEQAKQYKQYTYPGSPWCLTYMENMFDSYTSDDINQIYFCLRNGFENIKPEVGANAPLDEYGLSMLCIIVNENGELSYCTSRWNHTNGGNDSVMNPKQISEVVGVNFYNTFKPNNKWNELITNVKQRLSNGENPEKIFDEVRNFSDGFASVELNDKCNFINTNGEILCDQWFDWVGAFYEGFARVRLRGKGYNFINTNGEIAFNQWFDSVGNFKNGFARVKLNDKCNFINTDGEIAFNQWFDWLSDFNNGFASVELNGKCNFINTDGEIAFNQWYDNVSDFENGFASVELNGKWNFINTNGKIAFNQWLDWVSDFSNGYAMVKLNGKDYYLRRDGVLCDYNTKKPLQESKINNINNINNINMKQSIKLTESELRNIIKESVNNILSELDWRTADIAHKQAMSKANDNRYNKYQRAKYLKQGKNFEKYRNNKFDTQYNLQGIGDYENFDTAEELSDSNLTTGQLKQLGKRKNDLNNWLSGNTEYRNGQWRKKNVLNSNDTTDYQPFTI